MRKIYYLNFKFLFAVKNMIGQEIVGKRLLVALLNCAAVLWLDSLPVFADEYQSKPDDPAFAILNPCKVPDSGPLVLQPGDRLAIIGDFITEQKRYSQIIETYLIACVPELKIITRQYEWSGETAEGLDGNIGTLTVDLERQTASASPGHNIESFTNNE